MIVKVRWQIGVMIVFTLLFLFIAPLLAQESQGFGAENKPLRGEQNITGKEERIIAFAGRQWVVKSGCGLGPGPNCWSDSEQSVWVDENGWLHLKIREEDGSWYSAEVYTQEPTHYGLHRFYMIGRLDNLDPNVVAAPFLYY